MPGNRVFNVSDFQTFTAINLLSDPGHVGGPLVIPNAIKVVFSWTLVNGKTAHNVLFGNVPGGFTPTAAIAENIRNGMASGAQWTALAAFFPTAASFAAVLLQDVRSAAQPYISSTGAATPGTSASGPMPDEVAVAVTLRTARTGRQWRGRIYIPCWAQNAGAAGGVVAAGAVTALQNWANNIPTSFTNNGLTLSLGQPARIAYTSPITGVSYPARNATTVPITQLQVKDNHWDSQRRRGLK